MTKTRDERLDLIDAVSDLQQAHKAIVDKYTIETRSRLGGLLDILRGKNAAYSNGRHLSRLTAREMLEAIKELKLKPEKGRGKDLYRIEKLLSELEEACQGM